MVGLNILTFMSQVKEVFMLRIPNVVFDNYVLIDILNKLAKEGLSEYFMVVGPHALYAYEAAAGVRFGEEAGLPTQVIALLLNAGNACVLSQKWQIWGY